MDGVRVVGLHAHGRDLQGVLAAVVRQAEEPLAGGRLRHARLEVVLVYVNLSLTLWEVVLVLQGGVFAALPSSSLRWRPSNEILPLESLAELFNFVFVFDKLAFNFGGDILLVLGPVLVLLSLSEAISALVFSWGARNLGFVLQLFRQLGVVLFRLRLLVRVERLSEGRTLFQRRCTCLLLVQP